MDAPKLKRGFRLNLCRRGEQRAHTIASIGLVSDGGLWVTPAPVPGFDFTYGTVGSDALDEDWVTIEDRPKLHYHRSGLVGVTLSGTELPRRSIWLPPLPDLTAAQVFSITVTWPWDLPSTTNLDRKGDVNVFGHQDSASAWFTLSIINMLDNARPVPGLEPLGLFDGDPSTFYVGLEGYGRREIVIGQSSWSLANQSPDVLLPAVCVVAMGESPPALGLWTSHLDRPAVALVQPSGQYDPEVIGRPPGGLSLDHPVHRQDLFRED